MAVATTGSPKHSCYLHLGSFDPSYSLHILAERVDVLVRERDLPGETLGALLAGESPVANPPVDRAWGDTDGLGGARDRVGAIVPL